PDRLTDVLVSFLCECLREVCCNEKVRALKICLQIFTLLKDLIREQDFGLDELKAYNARATTIVSHIEAVCDYWCSQNDDPATDAVGFMYLSKLGDDHWIDDTVMICTNDGSRDGAAFKATLMGPRLELQQRLILARLLATKAIQIDLT